MLIDTSFGWTILGKLTGSLFHAPMARSAWYNVPRILTKFMDVNVMHKNAKIWCQIHPDIKDQKRHSFLHSSFMPRLSTCLSCILNSWCQERIWYWSSGILEHCIVILYGTFHNNDVVSPGHKMLIPYIFVGLVGVLLLAQNLYLSLLKN